MKNKIHEYVFVMEDGKKLIASGSDEFSAFCSIARASEGEAVDYYGENSDTGIVNIRGGNFFNTELQKFIAKQDEEESYLVTERLAAEEKASQHCSGKTESNGSPDSHTEILEIGDAIFDIFDAYCPGFRQMTDMFPGTGPDETLSDSIKNMVSDELQQKP